MVASGQHILVILEQGAVPFCSYENPHYHSVAEPRWMSTELLSAFMRHARKQQIAPTFLLGKTRPPAGLEKLIDTVAHAKIVPLPLAEEYPDAVLVLDAEDKASFADLSDSVERNVILRVAKPKGVSAMAEALRGKFKRLSLHQTGLEYFTDADMAVYEDELGKIAKMLGTLYRGGEGVEINVLSDRIMLTAMRNCGAGADHLTLAPNGKLYICPAFYFEDEADFIGEFDPKKGLVAKPIAAVELARAPLCSRCDAFHCKRCVFLNRMTTLELNVPSEQQCALAHTEREASRQLLIDLGKLEPFARMPRIPELTYRDPLECIDMPPRADPASDPML